MQDFLPSSTDSQSEQAMNEALADVDRALATLDRILEKRARSIAGNLAKLGTSSITRSQSRRSVIIGSTINALQGLISGASSSQQTVFNPNAGDSNRFPASNGLQLSDLAALLQRIMGRNL